MRGFNILLVLLLVGCAAQAQSFRRIKYMPFTANQTSYFPESPEQINQGALFESNTGFVGYTFYTSRATGSRLPFRDPLATAALVSGVTFDYRVQELQQGNVHNMGNLTDTGIMKLPDNYIAPQAPDAPRR